MSRTDYADLHGLALPPEPAIATGRKMQPITRAAIDAILPHVRPPERYTLKRRTAKSPAEYLHALLQHNPGRLPDPVADLVTAAINIEGPAERTARHARQAEAARRVNRLLAGGARPVGAQYRAAGIDLEFQHRHAAMLQRMGASPADAAREAAAYQRYVAEDLR